jgi:hypothetical protein
MQVEFKCINVRRNTTVLQIVEEINYMFRPFSGWAIIMLRLEYRRKLIYYNVDIKNGGTRSRFTMFGYIYTMWILRC